MFSKKDFAIVSYLRLISRTNLMFSWDGPEKKSFITSGPEQTGQELDRTPSDQDLHCLPPTLRDFRYSNWL